MSDPDYVKLLELRVEALSRAVLNIGSDLVSAGMAEHSPPHNEMIQMGGWALGLLEVLGIEISQIRDWQEEE